MITRLLSALFPKTIAAIRGQAYATGSADMAQIYFDIITAKKKEEA